MYRKSNNIFVIIYLDYLNKTNEIKPYLESETSKLVEYTKA